MNKLLIQWRKFHKKKELYFLRYSISKFRDFSEFFRDFLDFEHIYENATLTFKVKIYKNVPLIFEFRNLQKCHSNFYSKNLQKCPSDLQKCHSTRSQSKTRIL